jgi:predicted nuclease with TOPRIM domain
MAMIDILTLIGGVMLTIIGYFLKSTMDDLKSVKILSYETKNKLDILQNDHINKNANLSDRFDELKTALNELTKELKELNKKAR